MIDLDDLRERMHDHDTINDTAVVVLTAREVYDLLAAFETLNGKVAAYEDLIVELWNDIDGYYAARYYDDALLNEALAHALARGPA